MATANAPLTFSFLITEKCNLNCKHCFNHDNKYGKNALPLDEYEKLAKKYCFASEFLRRRTVLRNDFVKSYHYFKKIVI